MDIEILSEGNQFSSLGLNRNFQFLGDAYRYRIEKTLTLSGNILDLANAFGVSGITSEIESSLIAFLNDWGDIKINGVSFGSGFMSSISFSSGSDVRTKSYTASFIIYEDGDLGNLRDESHSIILSNSDLRYANQITESFEQSSDQKNKSYTHQVNINILDYNGPGSGVALSKAVAQKLLDSEDFTVLYWGSKRTPYNTYYTESYGTITNDCSFTKKYLLIEGENDFLKKKNLSFSFDQSGVIKVSLKAEFTGKWNKINEIVDAAKLDQANAFSECLSAFSSYANYNIGSSASLIDKPLEKSFTIANNRGYCSYEVAYTNDLFFSKEYEDGGLVGSSYWEYTRNISFDERGVCSIKEAGSITGPDHINDFEKQIAANNFWSSSVKPSIYGRSFAFYSSYADSIDEGCSSGDIYLVSSSVKKHNKIGQVSYTYVYTDSLDRERGANMGYVSISTSCKRDIDPIIVSRDFVVPNLREIKQTATRNLNHSSNSFSCSIIGGSNNNIQHYLSVLENEFFSSSCRLPFIEDASYSFSPLSNSFSSQISSFDAFPV